MPTSAGKSLVTVCPTFLENSSALVCLKLCISSYIVSSAFVDDKMVSSHSLDSVSKFCKFSSDGIISANDTHNAFFELDLLVF